MSAQKPNVLVIMTDEERYVPSYERVALEEFRRDRFPARTGLAEQGVELHRHYVGSTACTPSRATLFTGQYPSLHGVVCTDGLAKTASDPAMFWLDPDGVPTLGDWFRAAGYQTHYRGKWHISHADLHAHDHYGPLETNTVAGSVMEDAVSEYRAADPLDPFGFSGWIGPEPHGAHPANTGFVRDPIFADQIAELFGELAAQPEEAAPWLAVASLLNPHDIAFSGAGWELFGFEPAPDWVPAVPEAPSQSDSLEQRPACQAEFRDLWPEILYPQPADVEYRRFYHYLLALVDESIGRILHSLEESGLAQDTIIMFTSDHGDLLGAHGGLQQKWHNAYDEAIRVPMVLSGPGIAAGSLDLPTSHVDVLPTLLGLVGADPADLIDIVGRDHYEAVVPCGRDLSGVLRGEIPPEQVAAPLYFMTEDQITRGQRNTGLISEAVFEPVRSPSCIETVVAELDGVLWKLNHYYEPEGATIEDWELHDLSGDPEERVNRAADRGAPRDLLEDLLDEQRRSKRLTPRASPPQ